MITLVVGEAPAPSQEGRDAFVPSSVSGARLASLIGVPDARFVVMTLNLFDTTEEADQAELGEWQRRALVLADEFPAHRLVLCGQKVSRAFLGTRALDVDYWTAVEIERVLGLPSRKVMVIPHPSGRNRYWNGVNHDSLMSFQETLRAFIGPRFRFRAMPINRYSHYDEPLAAVYHSAGSGWDAHDLAVKARQLLPGESAIQVETFDTAGGTVEPMVIYDGRVRNLETYAASWMADAPCLSCWGMPANPERCRSRYEGTRCTFALWHRGVHGACDGSGGLRHTWTDLEATGSVARCPARRQLRDFAFACTWCVSERQCENRVGPDGYCCTRAQGHTGAHVGCVPGSSYPSDHALSRWSSEDEGCECQSGSGACQNRGLSPQLYICTQPRGHSGDHVACIPGHEHDLERWPQQVRERRQ